MKVMLASIIVCLNILVIIKLRKTISRRNITVTCQSKRSKGTISSDSENRKIETCMQTVSNLVSRNVNLKQEKLVQKMFKVNRTQKISFEVQETRLTVLLISILSSYTILTTPNTVLQCYWLWGDTMALWTTSGFNLRLISAPVNVLLSCNYSLNFYLYCVANRDIKDAMVKSILSMFNCTAQAKYKKKSMSTKSDGEKTDEKPCGCALHSDNLSS